jgi:hypothetical protein
MASSISNTNSRVAMPPPPQKPEEAFKKIDSTSKGYITESDLASAIVKFSPEGMSLSQSDAESVAKQTFTKMDADSDGKVTQGEFKDAAPKRSPNGGPSAGRPDGPPPGPGPSGPSSSSGAKTSGSSQSYDPADTNQDRTVSEMERLAYASKQLIAATPGSVSTTIEAVNTNKPLGNDS